MNGERSRLYEEPESGTRTFGGCLVTAVLILFVGCAHPQPEKPSVKELFREAVNDSRVLEEGPAEKVAMEQAGKGSKKQEETGEEPDKPDRIPGRKQPAGPEVSATFTRTNIRQAIRSLSDRAGVNVLLDPQVTGTVSSIIEKEPFEAALRRLLQTRGYVYRKGEDRYLVGVSDPSSKLFSDIAVRKTYRVRHRAAKKLVDLLPDRLRTFTTIDQKLQLVKVEAPRATVHEIMQRLQEADQPVRQVVIEAIVAVFSPDTRFRFGLDYEKGIQVDDKFINLAMEDLNLTGLYGPSQFSALRNFEFTSVFLQALSEEGYLTIRAAPRVMARDGKTARIRIGQQTFFNTQPTSNNTNFFVDTELEEVESGIVLEMAPKIRRNRVVIDLKNAEVSEEVRTEQRATALSSEFPIINRREVSTTVAVDDGQTIVIGGLVQKKVLNQVANFPYLSEVPGLGWLFHKRDAQQQAREVAVFLSPRIVER